MNHSAQHPLLALKELDDFYRSQHDYHFRASLGDWRGLGVRVGSALLLFDSRQIQEVIGDYRQLPLSSVPGAKAWFLGLASLRTQLLPLIDFCHFLGLPERDTPKKRRVVVLKQGMGLLVDETLGMRYFQMQEQARQGPTFDGRIGEFLAGVFLREQHYWAVIDVSRLSGDEDFRSVTREGQP